MTPTPLNKNLRRLAWLLVVILGFIQAWATRHFINPDGVSYLDVADKYIQQDWTWAVNAYWSPLYSWLLGAALYVLRPSSYWEYPVVHLVNFIVYLVAFACFEFLLSQVIRHSAERADRLSRDKSFLPAWAWQALGYVLFLWCTLVLITITVVTPDMCVAAAVFLLAGLLIRLRLQPERWSGFVWFGVALGVAYLAKAVMFPLAFVFLTVCVFSVGNLRKALPRVAVSLLLFLLVSAPFLLALHRAKGRWTFGESGRLAHAWLIDGPELYIHWRGFPPGSGVPAHPTKKIFDSPAVYEFKEPIKSTYPPWYDVSYWNEGRIGRFNPRGQVRVLRQGTLAYYAVFINSPIGMALLVSFLVLQLYRKKKPWARLTSIRLWNIMIPAIVALGLYALIHVQTRYIGAFIVLIWLGLFSSVTLEKEEHSGRVNYAVIVAMVVASMTVIMAESMAPAYVTLRDMIRGDDGSSATYWQVSDGLARMGVQPGDQVGVIAVGIGTGSFWARLAKVQIIAEITAGSNMALRQDVDKFWHSDDDVKQKVIEAFAKTGVKAIVANQMPAGVSHPGWQRIGNTDHYVYFLKPNKNSS